MAFYEYVIKQLTANFEAGKICKSQFDYIGLSIQHKYIEALEDIISDKESELYHLPNPRKLNLVSAQSRPDLSFMTFDLNVSKSIEPEEAMRKATKAFKRLKQLNSRKNIKFSKLGDISKLKIVL